MDPYDIGEAFAEIEAELINSMIRNMKHHRAEETKEGFEWTQWQVEQLKALEAYKKANQKKYKGKFRNINNLIEEAIKEARNMGNMEQEIEILEAIKKGFLDYSPRDAQIVGEFFKLNDRKLEALIKATKDDLKKAEHAMLRMAEDQYRQIIFNAQVYANTGAGTYEKAVDMATEDFISRGINCVEYSNGARHTIKDYADMALRTAAKRAYLTGEGEKRMEWGISTVIMNKRGNPCPKCLPFVGKVLIDDVWSGGSKEDGDYPLMSRAIELGLYHPRCKDSHSTYFEGISTPPDDSFSKKDIENIKTEYTVEQQSLYAKRQTQKYERLEKYSLDKENKQKYGARAEYWKSESESLLEQLYRPVTRGKEEIFEISKGKGIKVNRVESYKAPVYVSENAKIKPKALHTIKTNTENAMAEFGISKDNLPTIAIVSEGEMPKAWGKYDAVNNVVYYVPEIADTKIMPNKAMVERHEMWHLKQAVDYRASGKEITAENYSAYIKDLCNKCKKSIDAKGITEYNVGEISAYAERMFFAGRYDEVEAEFIIKTKRKE